MISIVPYQQTWPDEFRVLGQALRHALGNLAVRIDHIGSTAVPGLAAKDRIDMQVTVAALQPEVEAALDAIGYTRNVNIKGDHVPPGYAGPESDWGKWMFRAAAEQRPSNLHVRIVGKPNQRYPLLFRDYLRAFPASAEAYGRVKTALARLHPEDMEAYYDVKDPVCDLIMGGAEIWAATTGWQQGPSDC